MNDDVKAQGACIYTSHSISMTSEAASKSFTSQVTSFGPSREMRFRGARCSAVGVKRHRKVPFFLRGDPFFVRIRGCLSQKEHTLSPKTIFTGELACKNRRKGIKALSLPKPLAPLFGNQIPYIDIYERESACSAIVPPRAAANLRRQPPLLIGGAAIWWRR